MAYDYYCTSCGEILNQDKILFDMELLLTRDKEKHFQILKFRLTQQELFALLNSGEPQEKRYREVTLMFPDVMAFISNKNNLNDPMIAAVSMQEVIGYLDNANALLQSPEKKRSSDMDVFAEEEEEEEEVSQELAEPEKPYEVPEPILAIERKDLANTDRAFTQYALRSDFEILRTAFLNGESVGVRLKTEIEDDNEGKPIVVGYTADFPSGSETIKTARVCSKCGMPVFAHAGTAKHQSVAFIGSQSSGKTSTILALTHYAQNYMMADLSDFGDTGAAIWKGCKTIPEVSVVELLDRNPRLLTELKEYGNGRAPKKTEDMKRSDVYSATFRIKNKVQNKYYLLTLQDLPGELCLGETGEIAEKKVRDLFSVALSCDAYIVCFDTASIDPKGNGVVSWIQNVCKWTDDFQRLRAQENQVETYVPTMVLFTKCRELEDSSISSAPERIRQLLPIKKTYFLHQELQQISGNKLYRFVQDQFNQYGKLSTAYHAMMRCSPYGYAAPSGEAVAAAEKKGETLETKLPIPKNVDVLMRWLLSVTGCIPTDGRYQRSEDAVDSLKLNNYCISRPQLRTENPIKEDDLNEALARCTLFENPGHFDENIVGKYDTPWQLATIRFQAKLQKDSNARDRKD